MNLTNLRIYGCKFSFQCSHDCRWCRSWIHQCCEGQSHLHGHTQAKNVTNIQADVVSTLFKQCRPYRKDSLAVRGPGCFTSRLHCFALLWIAFVIALLSMFRSRQCRQHDGKTQNFPQTQWYRHMKISLHSLAAKGVTMLMSVKC